MRAVKLTNSLRDAHKGRPRQNGRAGMKRVAWGVMAMLASATVAGCISVNAPNDAIVIELNINITQEVIYRLAEDAGNTIDENADIF